MFISVAISSFNLRKDTSFREITVWLIWLKIFHWHWITEWYCYKLSRWGNIKFLVTIQWLWHTVSTCVHQHVFAGEPDKQHSQRGDSWSVDNSVLCERSQTACSHAPMSPNGSGWRLWHQHTHPLSKFTGPESSAIEQIEIVTLWCYQRMSEKWSRKIPR